MLDVLLNCLRRLRRDRDDHHWYLFFRLFAGFVVGGGDCLSCFVYRTDRYLYLLFVVRNLVPLCSQSVWIFAVCSG